MPVGPMHVTMVGMDTVEEVEDIEVLLGEDIMVQMVTAAMKEVEVVLTSLAFHWNIIFLDQVLEVLQEIMVVEEVVFL